MDTCAIKWQGDDQMNRTIVTVIVIILLGGVIFFALQQKLKHPLSAKSISSSMMQTNQNSQTSQNSTLFNENKSAPELTGITHWFNTQRPLTIQELRGKVILVDFWTNQCINCIRTLLILLNGMTCIIHKDLS